MKYEPCKKCGGKVTDAKPSYLPLDGDYVLKITDQVCTKCGIAIIGEHQRTEIISDREIHDKMRDFYKDIHGKAS